MSRFTVLTATIAVLAVVATGAQARKNPGNPLPAPVLVDAQILAAGEGECDGDEATTDDACVSVTFTKVCTATKYSVDVIKGFDTDGDSCVNGRINEDTSVDAEACTGELNCQEGTAECQTAVVPVGTATLCIDDGDGITDCVNDPEDVEVSYLSLCTKVKGLNPAQKGPNAISQSTPFSNTICPDENEECA
jgi:hypothetical protein